MNPLEARKAALALAAMHRSDRAWILRRLPADEAAQLRSMSRKLRSMGEVTPELVSCVQEELDDGSVYAVPPPPQELLLALRDLSPYWAATALRACAPDHLDMYAANCTPERAASVRACFECLPDRLPKGYAHAVAERMHARTSANDAVREGSES
ncbi:hypothetical protein GCM10027285_26830 [Oleiagrimonas citrea]|uniref:Uncharacterized protein n=1 Tax=Oleiagrimonas citrea TaxID=1665687 RepID=A0A846ZNJ6_9GAMM|nr:hypothetical protein [Oleiagrimonas citrea]NKZ39023.1 hypothetical protein [Oleiagrimonas citrea]